MNILRMRSGAWLVRGSAMLALLLIGRTAPAEWVATGGAVTNYSQDGTNFTAHIFTNSGLLLVNSNLSCDVLLVAGGGGGGETIAGGGGGGGVLYSDAFSTAPGFYAVTVGGGGAGGWGVGYPAGVRGGDSAFSTLTAIGGGAGAGYNVSVSGTGGSAGGNGAGGGTRGGFTAGQGNDGAAAIVSNAGGGGGGAGQPGTAAGTNGVGGNGGNGYASSISGALTVYAGGGGGGTRIGFGAGGSGGLGGGGAGGTGGNPGANGTPMTGGGGGGSGYSTEMTGGTGGSGIVIMRYVQVPVSMTAPAVTNLGPTNAEHTTVTVQGQITDIGGEIPSVWFHYWPDGGSTSTVAMGTQWGAFSTLLTGLARGTPYQYRILASNAAGTAWTDQKSFVTKEGAAAFYVATNGTGSGASWASAFTNMQTALDASQSGDTIYLKGGTYPITNQLLWTRSGVTILGAYEGAQETGPGDYDITRWPTILARPAGTAYTNRIMLVSGVSDGMLSRVSLVNGYLFTDRMATGGCLCVLGSTNLMLSSLTVTGGYIFSYQPLVAGAGVFVAASSNITLSGCTIRDNTGTCGNNDNIRGSGIYATNTSITITNCVIKNNSGGVYVATGADHGAFGAGLNLHNCQALVVDTTIAGNYSLGHSTAVALGAGVYVDGGTNLFRNCLIAGNDNRINSCDSSFHGDGAYLRRGVSTFANSTVIRNNGEGLYRLGGTVTVTNSIVWDNMDDLVNFPTNSQGTLSNVWMSCIQDGDNAGVQGCIASDPRFERGLYLAANSPCADAGGSEASEAGLAGLTTRADGTPDTGTVDMGYHFAGGLLNTPLADLYVDPAGADTNSGADPAHAFRSITKALSLATHGSRIHIASGLYTNKVEFFPLTINSLYGLELLGTNAASTVIKATGAGQAALFLRGVGDVRIEGLGVTGGSGSGAYASGGGVSIVASRLTIASCIISNNIPAAPAIGAGISLKNTFLLMTNSAIIRNSMSVPGGSVPWGYGGGIFVLGGELTLLDSSVISNSVGSRGVSRGGGICLGGNYGGNRHLISNCVFTANSVSSIGGLSQGGGMYSLAKSVVANCVIATNVAVTNGINYGGGIFLDSGSTALRYEFLSGTGDTALANCTIAGNAPEGVRQNATNDLLEIRNSILWNNGDDLISSNMPAALGRLSHSDIGNGDNIGTNGCLSADPLFANPSNDWHLLSRGGRWTPGAVWVKDAVTSPCIDAGDPAADYSLEPEPNGRRVNMGAYGNTSQASKKALVSGSVITIR